jgi:hypothetical protein
MKKLVLLVIIGVAGWQIYAKQSVPVLTNADLKSLSSSTETITKPSSVYGSNYSCDGRQYYSQMSSCEEAIFFIQNCPNTKILTKFLSELIDAAVVIEKVFTQLKRHWADA